MKIGIFCSDVNWIYGKFIQELRKHSVNEIVLNKKDVVCECYHYIPYYECPENPKHPCAAWFSHKEDRKDLSNKFISAAKSVDFAISQSKKYMNLLQTEYNINNIVQIVPGVDLQEFNFRGAGNSLVGKNKLVVGYVGRHYSSTTRKNAELLKKIGKLPFVELRVTGGKMPENKVPEFYKQLDLVISPATIEGGPLCLQESMAVGVPVVCFESVGMADEFADVINRVPMTGNIEKDNEAFVQFLKDVWTKKKIPFDDALAMRKKVAQFTWKNFCLNHDKLWERIVNEHRQHSKI